jgi:subtilisin family serine protease
MNGPLDALDKLDSRLRCVANGKPEINAVRSQQNGAVRVSKAIQGRQIPEMAATTVEQCAARPLTVVKSIRKGSKQTELSNEVEVSVFVLLTKDDAPTPPLVKRRNGRVGTATVTVAQLKDLNDHPSVQWIELGETLRVPDPRVGLADVKAPPAARHSALNKGKITAPNRKTVSLDKIGENVLVGIIDVGGLDFAHPDFMDDQGKSRILRIWDQGGNAFEPPQLSVVGGKAGESTGYGAEITNADIALALQEAANARVSPYDLAPQSQQVRGSHATHVASIAAGRTGLCKRARIAAVLIALPDADTDRRNSFYDTTRIVDAVAYLLDLAEAQALDAVSINISLGTNGGAHDGSEMVSRWIDAAMTTPGRVVTVAAGNSGQEAPEYEGDLGIWSGRVHASGRIPAVDLRRDLEWIVVGNGLEDVSENELEVWYGAQDEFDVELFTPDGYRIGPISPGERIENLLLKSKTVVSIYNLLSDPKNGDNRISIYLSPFMGEPIIGIQAGRWKVRLIGKVVRHGAFNAWIERDDPGRIGSVPRSQWRLPSYFGPGTFVDESTLSSLACGPRVMGVANLDEARELLNVTSSQGPTRDRRLKPEIAAPGTNIVAACGFDADSQWIEMSGTSMASPHVAGVAALMMSLNPKLTAAQIGGIMQRKSRPLPGQSYEWQNGAGFGVIDAEACLCEVWRISQPAHDRTDDFAKRHFP